MIDLDELTEEEKILLRMAFRLVDIAVNSTNEFYDSANHSNDLFNLKEKLGIWEFVS